jgi:Na+-translocating ferredoxin:NAD+ oxidoreductase RnfD subunit
MKTWNFYGLTIVEVKLKDPRVFMSCVLIIYTIVGQTILTFDHGWTQILLSLFVACSVDVLLNFWKTRQIIVPLSGVITGLGLGLLIEATSPTLLWPYIVAPIIAIASKSLVRIHGRHIFNPSNFGLVVLLLLFPTEVTTTVTQWTGSLLMVGIIFIVGTFSAFRVSRLDLVLSFIGGFCVMALIEELTWHSGYSLVFGPLFGAGLQLFILSMITDPKTTPNTSGMRIAFGLSIALIDGLLRLANNQYSPFIALFIVSACFSLYQAIINTNWTQQPTTNVQIDQNRLTETPVLAATNGQLAESVQVDQALISQNNEHLTEDKAAEEQTLVTSQEHLEKIAQPEEPLLVKKDGQNNESELIEIHNQVRT